MSPLSMITGTILVLHHAFVARIPNRRGVDPREHGRFYALRKEVLDTFLIRSTKCLNIEPDRQIEQGMGGQ